MTAIQVRDLSSELYEHLQREAQRAHRSMSQQLVAMIEKDFQEITELREQEEAEREERVRRIVREEIERERAQARRQPKLTPEQVKEREEFFEYLRNKPPVKIPEGFPSDVELVRMGRDAR